MAALIISYFGSVRRGIAGDPIRSESLTTSTASAASAAIPANAAVAAIASDTAHYVMIGTGTPTAAIGNGFYLPANTIRELSVNDVGGTYKIAAVTLS
jgi:hypothetical protein